MSHPIETYDFIEKIVAHLDWRSLAHFSNVNSTIKSILSEDINFENGLWQPHFETYFPNEKKGQHETFKQAFAKEYTKLITDIQKNPFTLGKASDAFKNDEYLVKECIERDGRAIIYASKQLQKTKEIVLIAVKNCGVAIEYLPKELKDDKDIALAAVKSKPVVYRWLCDELKGDRDIVLAAVSRMPFYLKGVADRFKTDKEIVLAAVRKSGDAIYDASEKLQNDSDILYAAAMDEKSSVRMSSNRGRGGSISFFLPYNGMKFTGVPDECHKETEVKVEGSSITP
jgi:Domain of unknown function (DUF4116)